MLGKRRFHFQPVLTAFVGVGLVILIALGNWQMDRRAWKMDLIEKTETRVAQTPISFIDAAARADAGEDMAYTPVFFDGALDTSKQARVFGAINGKAGVFVFAPTRTADPSVYINLGFAPQEIAGDDCFCQEVVSAPIRHIGLFRYTENLSPPASWFRTESRSPDGLWHLRDPAAFAAANNAGASPYYIDRFETPGAEWPQGGATRLVFRNKHMEYALTWYGLAVTLIGVWFAFSLKTRP